jgi:hypothetical protein
LLADKALEGTVPGDIARERQQQLAAQLAKAETDLMRLNQLARAARVDVERIFELAKHAAEAYKRSSDHLRREWNYASYEVFEIDVEYEEPFVVEAVRTPTFEGLRTAARRNRHHQGKRKAGVSNRVGSTVGLLVEAMVSEFMR